MSDLGTIGQLLNQAMQAGQVENVGHADGGTFDVLEVTGSGLRLFLSFDKETGAAINATLDEMKESLAVAGVTG